MRLPTWRPPPHPPRRNLRHPMALTISPCCCALHPLTAPHQAPCTPRLATQPCEQPTLRSRLWSRLWYLFPVCMRAGDSGGPLMFNTHNVSDPLGGDPTGDRLVGLTSWCVELKGIVTWISHLCQSYIKASYPQDQHCTAGLCDQSSDEGGYESTSKAENRGEAR